jgi:hypothetical protein
MFRMRTNVLRMTNEDVAATGHDRPSALGYLRKRSFHIALWLKTGYQNRERRGWYRVWATRLELPITLKLQVDILGAGHVVGRRVSGHGEFESKSGRYKLVMVSLLACGAHRYGF